MPKPIDTASAQIAAINQMTAALNMLADALRKQRKATLARDAAALTPEGRAYVAQAKQEGRENRTREARDAANMRALVIAHCHRIGCDIPPEGSGEWDSILSDATESANAAEAHDRIARSRRRAR